MLKPILITLLPLMLFFGENSGLFPEIGTSSRQGDSGTLEKMVVASGTIVMDLDMAALTGSGAAASLRFKSSTDSFFTVQVYNGELRGPVPSSLGIVPEISAYLPAKFAQSYNQLVIESLPWGGHYDLVVRDATTGFTFFNIEGYEFDYDPTQRVLGIKGGRMLIANEFAAELGRPADAGKIVGAFGMTSSMRAIEVQQIRDGEVQSAVLPAGAGMSPDAGTVPGPDVIVGDVNGLAQFGSASGGFVGLALGTDSCNAGVVNLNWNALPSNDHPVIPQNMYRMSGGANNDERFEQIGQSSVKHGFTALTQNICGFGCNGVGGPSLGSGCSDPYSASLNAGPALGSRAWVNPFTGFFPRGDSPTPPNSHSGHTHPGPAHRILTQIEDLTASTNPGATYYAEGQYVTPHEFSWCQTHPGECNMNNNVSYRRYNVFGTASPFSFSPVGSTVRMKPAISAWTGATLVDFQPDPATDGVGIIGFKVTNPSPGVWHYEYAVYNQNLDRAIQALSVPVGTATITNLGFHAPPQHPGYAADGTTDNAGFSGAPWASSLADGKLTWSTESLAQNPNANAIRWGTLYNFRFDANAPPAAAEATIGFYKSGQPIVVRIEAPSAPSSPVSVSGRVLTPEGIAIRNIVVRMTETNGTVRTATTNTFGLYSFENVETGKTYTLSASSRRYRFAPRIVSVNNALTDMDFIGMQ